MWAYLALAKRLCVVWRRGEEKVVVALGRALLREVKDMGIRGGRKLKKRGSGAQDKEAIHQRASRGLPTG